MSHEAPNNFPMMMEVPEDAGIEDILRGLGDEGLNDFLDLLTALRNQNEQHGCDRLETDLTEDSPDYFRGQGDALLAFGDLDTVFQAHNDLRQSGNHRYASVCYDEDGHFYLFQSPDEA
ncbi:ferritin family protein [Acidithiobacillus ferrooxidans]|uniref:Uncharacterized protein n=1 Tax=Acidithiobacillus ferrooxidans TaxID=920 RepID=A0A2W1K4Q4_ACIFR|nr:hypothetical protein [Acidithiobacillus ferrooxidans]MBU2818250.1 hypothetical protein [Acidithiobacillus ferrooxidans]MCR1341723.1 hypothetical protein [Acidithiobacillus ferrooxidans]PZD81846.1 hypothetical protein DN052_01865 [Acidithiobacillus ferrooxidans]QLK41862.1 hypothetical protein FE661_06625 [Acidithiobacillus ferrooxidans]QZT53820.1 hypothetical protein K7B00_06590 [Acidithiobacillus ferrooxidans]